MVEFPDFVKGPPYSNPVVQIRETEGKAYGQIIALRNPNWREEPNRAIAGVVIGTDIEGWKTEDPDRVWPERGEFSLAWGRGEDRIVLKEKPSKIYLKSPTPYPDIRNRTDVPVEVEAPMPMWQKAGIGVAGVAIATGFIGKWLDWW